MTNSILYLKFLLLWSFLFPAPVLCQTQSLDTGFLFSALQHTKEIYSNSIGSQSHLYNGVYYKEYNARSTDRGIPYFESDDWVEGTVEYDGENHEHVSILYDLVNDKVVIEHGTRGVKLQLIDEKLSYFTLPGHFFVRLVRDSLRNATIQSGYYDLLCNGETKFYVRWHKNYLQTIEGLEIQSIFTDHNSYYIFKNGSYFPVRTKSSVLEVLQDNKSLRKFIRKNNINFRKNRVKAITSIVRFYNEP